MTALNEKIYDVVTTAAASIVTSYRPPFVHMTESPIEELLAFAIWANLGWPGRAEVLDHCICFETAKLDIATSKMFTTAKVAAQVQIGDYRVDFLFYHTGPLTLPPIYLAVECDGHDYHERTKEQAARDRKRDRDLLAMGVKVMRFTGAQIWADAGGCASAVMDYVEQQDHEAYTREMERIERDHGSFEDYMSFLKRRLAEKAEAAKSAGSWPEEVPA